MALSRNTQSELFLPSSFGVIAFLLFFVVGGIFFSDVLFSQTMSVQEELKARYKEKIVTDHPKVVSRSVSVVFFNEQELRYPENGVSYRFSFPEGADLLGRTLLPLTFMDRYGDPVLEIKVAAEVTAKSYYLRTLKQLKRRSKLTEKMVERVLLDTYGKPLNSVFDFNEILGKEIKATVAKNTIITSGMVQHPQIIRKGDHVLILLETEGMSLRLKGRSLDDGALNEMIRVQSSYKSRRILQGEVIDESTVRVSFMY